VADGVRERLNCLLGVSASAASSESPWAAPEAAQPRRRAMRTRGDKRRSVEALAWDAWCVYREVKHEKFVARRKELEKVVKVGGWGRGTLCWRDEGSLVARLQRPFSTRVGMRARRQRAGEVVGWAGMRAGRRVGAEALSVSNATHNAVEASTQPLFFSLLLCATRARTQARRQPDRWIGRHQCIRADGVRAPRRGGSETPSTLPSGHPPTHRLPPLSVVAACC
jgi:hypothetical protein